MVYEPTLHCCAMYHGNILSPSFRKQEFWDFQVFFFSGMHQQLQMKQDCALFWKFTSFQFFEISEKFTPRWQFKPTIPNHIITKFLVWFVSALVLLRTWHIWRRLQINCQEAAFPSSKDWNFLKHCCKKLQVQFCHRSRVEKSWQHWKEEEGTIFPHGKLAVTSCLRGRAAFWVWIEVKLVFIWKVSNLNSLGQNSC